ncbi:hypothetical protein BKH41_05480 [Helicobacter sp. 12S02232-10]|uniref:tetratricopeptide repeat protein n=1 Tax=Helicobacter sp. 12S02232-10 TaxID=1476197 RepID=UPI000BA78B87|nr:tetratricopeptide repeat protein [Helicobacter sp. 12S02232-10]PAF48717.1 hypothetical protein BKH41_05480 [Helicobacter sp. 12S02232-10]
MAKKQISDPITQGINSITDADIPKSASPSKLIDKLKLKLQNFFNNEKIQSLKDFISVKYAKIKQNKKIFFSTISIVAVLIVATIILIIVSILPSHPSTQNIPAKNKNSKIETPLPQIPKLETKIPEISDKSLDNLIKKANILYNNGEKTEALNIFSNIASFSQSIANHNLGVIKLKEKNYADSIASFDNSISSGENISVSAIDAMVSAYYLKRIDLYNYYLKLVNSHISDSDHEPFYSYLYGLAQYYNGYYFEALSPLLNPNSESFKEQNHRLASKIFLVFNDDYNALAHLQEIAAPKDYKSLGLLYARVGEYGKAKSYLYKYLNANSDDLEALLAIQIIDLKLGNFAAAASALESIASNKDVAKKAMETYPIKVILNPSLFDVNLAQEEFWHRSFEIQEKIPYKIIFYYAPFRVFDVQEALKMIREGGVFSDIRNIEEAKNTLVRGGTISTINKNIAKALIELNKNNIRDALKYLKISAKSNPNHAVLHYNIGLIYAQMEDFQNAYNHFLRAYHLNSYDITSGLFAIIAGDFIYQDTTRIMHQISQDFESIPFKSQTQKKFLSSFIGYLNNNIDDDMDWIEQAQKKFPIYYALKAAYGIRNKNKTALLETFSKLKSIYPKDVVSNVLYELAHSYDTNLKQVALKLHNLFLSDKLDLSSVYYGPAFTRELYVYIGFITGSLENQERDLEQKLISQTDTPNGILQTMALINIYQHKFEKAYTLYNTLIENLKENDAQTKFFAAVSAIGANHPENAVLLLQLAKMDSPTNYESRYALGLLYQEIGNFKAAAAHYNYISVANFKSEFFDFDIDTKNSKAAQNNE